jgi:capsular polysaccharide biosynthesis protein
VERSNEVQTENGFSLFNVLYRNLLLIIIATIIGLLAGLGVAFLLAKPTYTASKRVMFITKYSTPVDDKGNPINTAGNDMLLAKLYLPNAVDKIKSQILIYDANELYEGEGKISANAISASYGEESLIFSLSYTDRSEEEAAKKLEAIIESAKINFPKPSFSVAKDSTLREVENRASVVKNSNFGKYIIIGALAGLVLAVAYVIIKEATDVTIKDKAELEALTGVSVIACIDDAAIVEKRRLEKEKEEKRRKKAKK